MTSPKDQQSIERLARLMRVSREQDLSEATRSALKEMLLEELGAGPSVESSPQVAPPPQTPQQRVESRQAATAAPKATRTPLNPDQLELRLRQLAQAEAPWRDMKPVIHDLMALRPTAETFARMLELTFLRGTPADSAAVLAKGYAACGSDFYRATHQAVRAQFTVRMWRDDSDAGLKALLLKEKDEDYLTPIERLAAFDALARGDDPATPYIYYQHFRPELIEASREFGGHIGMAPPAFCLAIGRLAAQLGHLDEARDILETIPEDVAERDPALHLMLEATAQKNRVVPSHYVEKLVAEPEPMGRLKRLADFLAATRSLGGFRDLNRPALNEILRNPCEFFHEDPAVYATLSELLTANRDLDGLLPNFYELFRQHAVKFLGPVLDAALWQGPLQANAATPRHKYWRGIALLHHYINCGVGAEDKLWEARDLVESSRRKLAEPMPYAWRDLHKAAYAWVSRNHYVIETDRLKMLEQLRVAVDDKQAAVSDIEDYMRHADQPPRIALDGLQSLAAAKNAPGLESRILLKRAAHAHLTNQDLTRLWHLANARKDHDLAWRVATILQSRLALSRSIRHAWEISGEKRAHYPLQGVDKALLESMLRDLPATQRRLAHAMAHIGPLLPELLAMLDPGATAARVSAPPADSIEAKVEKALQALDWLPAQKKRYRFSQDAAVAATDLPAFAQILPANPWSILTARLSERLGLNAFGYRLSKLARETQELVPRLATRQDLRRHSGRVAAWLRDLTPDQRAAWQDLGPLARTIDDAEAAHAMASLVCRLAVVMLPNHLLALSTLQSMRAPVSIIWSVEIFLLSDGYSQLRQKLGSASKVMVPNALQRLAQAHAEVKLEEGSIKLFSEESSPFLERPGFDNADL